MMQQHNKYSPDRINMINTSYSVAAGGVDFFVALRYFHRVVMQKLSVFRGGNTFLLFEQATEIQGVFIAHNGGYLGHIVICCFQQTDSIVDSSHKNILHRGHTDDLFEVTQKPADAHTAGYGELFNVDGLVVVLIKIPSGVFHFLLKICVDSGFLLLAGTLD